MNIFSVLDTSDNEEEVVQKKTTKKTTKEEEKPQAKGAKAQPQAKPKEAKTEAKPAAADNEPKEKKDDNRGGRPRGKEGFRHGDKHHGNEEAKTRRPKREFDRRSGTGRGKELSRGGRGPYGFGNVEQEAQEAEKDPAKVEAAEGAAENVDDAAEPEAESAEVAEPEEPPTISFDDFIKQREEARANSNVFAPKSVRTVNVDAQFAGLTSKADDLEAEEQANKASAAKKDQRSTQKTQLLDVAFKFESQRDTRFGDDRRGRGGRGDRDFSKGGRGRGRGGGRGRGNAPAPLNSVDFPSL